jgi:hypothetical protein
MKIEITVTRNDKPLTTGYTEEYLIGYLGRYVAKYGYQDSIHRDFPEFDFTGETLEGIETPQS